MVNGKERTSDENNNVDLHIHNSDMQHFDTSLSKSTNRYIAGMDRVSSWHRFR